MAGWVNSDTDQFAVPQAPSNLSMRCRGLPMIANEGGLEEEVETGSAQRVGSERDMFSPTLHSSLIQGTIPG